MDDMWPIINEFLTESYENLDQLDQDLVELEAHPDEQSLLASIFRTIHTIKGTCGFLGFTKLESVAHVGENLLSKLRDGELSMTPAIASALLSMVDAIRQVLSCIEKDQNEGDVDYSALVETLTRLQAGEDVELDAVTPTKKSSDNPTSVSEESKNDDLGVVVSSEEKTENASSSVAGSSGKSPLEQLGGHVFIELTVDMLYDKLTKDERVKQFFEGLDLVVLRRHMREFLVGSLKEPSEDLSSELNESHQTLAEKGFVDSHFEVVMENLGATLQALNMKEEFASLVTAKVLSVKDKFLNKGEMQNAPSEQPNSSMVASESAQPNQEASKEEQPQQEMQKAPENNENSSPSTNESKPSNPGAPPSRSSESIRVDVEMLDSLMNLVGELVLARNQIMQFTATEKDATFIATTQHLNQLTTELQEGVMKTRMQPIGNIWNKFPRVVRDLSHSVNKQVRLEMEGKETELDKTLIEAIKDPLTHIVRNSVDHGIESPEARQSKGKNPEGVLKLRAYHEGGQVNIDIIDDGGGIDPEKIRQKALSKSLITQQQSTKMSDREVVNLIFNPGFSTAEKVSNISGRGVGMDVVKTNIEKIGGTVDIQTKVNEGTSLKVKIPLTLAIIPALVVKCGGWRYAIPQVSLVELVRLEADQATQGIEEIQGAPVYRLRGNLLPLVYLHQELDVSQQLEEAGVINIVVLQADKRQFGLVVDGILDTEEIVVKPLSKQLKGITAFAGATIMGDGKVALILDVMGLAQKARVLSEASHGQAASDATEKSDSNNGELQTLLIFSLGQEGRMAVPLSMVARLEEFKRGTIEHSGDQDVVQYRGEIMPLIYLSDVFGGMRPETEEMQVIVYSAQGRSVGVVVGEIIDIVEEMVTVKQGSGGQGVLGSAVVHGKVTDLLDVEGVIRSADPSFYDESLMVG